MSNNSWNMHMNTFLLYCSLGWINLSLSWPATPFTTEGEWPLKFCFGSQQLTADTDTRSISSFRITEPYNDVFLFLSSFLFRPVVWIAFFYVLVTTFWIYFNHCCISNSSLIILVETAKNKKKVGTILALGIFVIEQQKYSWMGKNVWKLLSFVLVHKFSLVVCWSAWKNNLVLFSQCLFLQSTLKQQSNLNVASDSKTPMISMSQARERTAQCGCGCFNERNFGFQTLTCKRETDSFKLQRKKMSKAWMSLRHSCFRIRNERTAWEK